jgi:ABC-type transport system involved in multi-copper enzyme maturation permease subunit
MNSFWAVFKRELKSYFTTPLAYVFLGISDVQRRVL